ncbi:MAG: hypothetical protein AAF648_03570 [Pseudomonadota bacterium]
MFELLTAQFRFRGKQARLLDLYQCFLANDQKALHPTQLARMTGISLAEVSKRLDTTPELFVRLPRRPDGITRYRLTTAATARGLEGTEALLATNARRETLVLYAGGTMLVLIGIIAIVLIGPTL